MKKQHLQILGVGLIFAAIIFLTLSFGNKNDVDFCRYVFKGLIQGNQSVHKHLDWKNFKGLDIDVGKTYSTYPDHLREKYRRSFIYGFGFSFKEAGGRYAGFISWRIYKQSPSEVVVAADYLSKTLLFTVSKSADGKRMLSAIQWEAQGG